MQHVRACKLSYIDHAVHQLACADPSLSSKSIQPLLAPEVQLQASILASVTQHLTLGELQLRIGYVGIDSTCVRFRDVSPGHNYPLQDCEFDLKGGS